MPPSASRRSSGGAERPHVYPRAYNENSNNSRRSVAVHDEASQVDTGEEAEEEGEEEEKEDDDREEEETGRDGVEATSSREL